VRGLGLDGKVKTVKAHDVLAACLRHEFDHLEGVLIDTIGVMRTR
jgi:peptide deformylase